MRLIICAADHNRLPVCLESVRTYLPNHVPFVLLQSEGRAFQQVADQYPWAVYVAVGYNRDALTEYIQAPRPNGTLEATTLLLRDIHRLVRPIPVRDAYEALRREHDVLAMDLTVEHGSHNGCREVHHKGSTPFWTCSVYDPGVFGCVFRTHDVLANLLSGRWTCLDCRTRIGFYQERCIVTE